MPELRTQSPEEAAQWVHAEVGRNLRTGNGSVVSIRQQRGRSLSQNALFHVWMDELAKEMEKRSGNVVTAETMKVFVKAHLGIQRTGVDPFTGDEHVIPISTASYTKGEMYHVMEHVHAWAASNGIALPVHGEYADIRGAHNGQ